MKADVGELNTQLINKLIGKKLHISTAESCTGGLLSALLTQVPGASEVINECIVTYSNEAKMRELGVRKETLEAYGAVSEETAYEMCTGICRHTGSEIGIGITGIAGPGGGTEKKPVGTVCIGVCTKDKINISTQHFEGDRDKVRESSCIFALSKTLEML